MTKSDLVIHFDGSLSYRIEDQEWIKHVRTIPPSDYMRLSYDHRSQIVGQEYEQSRVIVEGSRLLAAKNRSRI